MSSYRNFDDDFSENSSEHFGGNSASLAGMTTPLSRKKLLVFGGIFLALLLLVLILVFSLRSGGSGSSSKGSDALHDGPTTAAVDSSRIKSDYKNKITENKDSIIKMFKDTLQVIKSPAGSLIWSVGASDCSAANQKDAVPQTLEGIDAAIRMASVVDELEVATTKDGLANAKSNNKVGVLIALGGGYTIDSRLAVLRMYYTLGARIMTLTGNCSTPWAENSKSTKATKLTAFGQDVVKEASRLGVVLDLAGSSETVINNVLEYMNSTPALFIGVGAKTLTDTTNNLANNTISALKAEKLKNSLVMVSFKCELIKIDTNCTVNEVIEHINMIATLASRAQVGIAADFGDEHATYPTDLSNMTALSNLFDKLHDQHNWSIDELKGLAYNNFLQLLMKAAAVDSSAEPIDGLESEEELSGGKNLTCYSDLSIRYAPDPAPTAPTTMGTTTITPTTNTTTATTNTTTPTTPVPTTKAP